ncbi:MAG: Lrp/AsnC family transcriptional regulator [Victivallaceae bacterium]|nr:Lrp/AsnC family transcriptional regulator [Victivallaceae bacterium]
MKKKILDILKRNARMEVAEIAGLLNADPEAVAAAIHELEADNVICGYHAVVNDELADDGMVRALIEVKVSPQRDGGFDRAAMRIARFPEVINVYLVSGNYDLQLEVYGRSLQDIANFVAAKLSTIDGVLSCSTLFMLKKYKESGRLMTNEPELERIVVSP